MVGYLTISAKLATLPILKIKISYSKGYDGKMFAYDIPNEILSRESKEIVDVLMWTKFGNFSFNLFSKLV